MALRIFSPPPFAAALVLLLAVAPAVSPALAATPVPILTLTGEVESDRFGSAVAATGDVNGDGFDDIVVGAQWHDTDGAGNAGRAYVYFGGPNRDATPDVVLEAPTTQSRALMGSAVAIAGDLNGDGWKDIAVGAPVSRLAGRVYLYWGGPSLDEHADRTLGGLGYLEFFGGAIAGVGDVTKDGYDDIWVGAPSFEPIIGSSTPPTRVGRGYLFYGGPTADGVVDAVYNARPIEDVTNLFQFGTSVAPAGDVNADGYPDLIVGQPADGVVTSGRAYVYYGAAISPHRVPERILLASEDRFRAGVSVSSADDFNGDGWLDQVVGAPDSGVDGDLTAGRAYVFFGGPAPDLFETASVELKGPSLYDAFGASVAAGKDVNGDGAPDILVGAPQAEGAAGLRAGRVYVYYGGPGADGVPDVVLEGNSMDATFGTAISLGDVDGDGVADAIIGATPVGSRTDPGHVYVYNLVSQLAARAFAHDEERTIPLHENGAPVCLRLEPVDDDFRVEDVDPASVGLTSAEAPGLTIGAAPAKRVVVSDADGNGIGETGVCFERADLARLFPAARGRRDVTARMEGTLIDGRRFAADVALTIVRTGPDRDLEATVAPNPMNPTATLTFTLRTPGRVDARLFDATGRVVKTIAAGLTLPAGPQRLRLDGRDDQGRPLASGIYFYRLSTSDGERHGRVVVAK